VLILILSQSPKGPSRCGPDASQLSPVPAQLWEKLLGTIEDMQEVRVRLQHLQQILSLLLPQPQISSGIFTDNLLSLVQALQTSLVHVKASVWFFTSASHVNRTSDTRWSGAGSTWPCTLQSLLVYSSNSPRLCR
jgi:hypothetical protein